MAKPFLFVALTLMMFYTKFSICNNYFIKVHFLYGSKPKKEYKKTESKWFGGIHGGHVEIEINDTVYGFGPYKKFHYIAHKKSDTAASVK